MQESVAERVPARPAGRLPRHVRVLLRLSRRELPEPVTQVVVERGIEVPAADGVRLLTDHYPPCRYRGTMRLAGARGPRCWCARRMAEASPGITCTVPRSHRNRRRDASHYGKSQPVTFC
jgi:hypothetical protein